MAASLILGITWLLISAALLHYALTHADERLLTRIRGQAAVMPRWAVAVGFTVVVWIAPICSLAWLVGKLRGGSRNG